MADRLNGAIEPYVNRIRRFIVLLQTSPDPVKTRGIELNIPG